MSGTAAPHICLIHARYACSECVWKAAAEKAEARVLELEAALAFCDRARREWIDAYQRMVDPFHEEGENR